jgi:hypothetical protein
MQYTEPEFRWAPAVRNTVATQPSLTVSCSTPYFIVLQVYAQGNRRPGKPDRTLTVDVS